MWQERTADVLAARRLQIINRLTAAEVADNQRAALQEALAVLKECDDIPFAVAYLMDALGKQALLVTATGVEDGDPMAPRQIAAVSANGGWPLKQIVEENKLVIVEDLGTRFGDGRNRHDQIMPESAVLYPLRDRAEGPFKLGRWWNLKTTTWQMGWMTGFAARSLRSPTALPSQRK